MKHQEKKTQSNELTQIFQISMFMQFKFHFKYSAVEKSLIYLFYTYRFNWVSLVEIE